jgi:hypothetical protein
MSAHGLANLVAQHGRGGDTTLVHMSPGEVISLRRLAQQHGGDLTVNPSTGLPEAGFLDSILPAVAGVGLSMVPGVGPLMAAGITGGITALTSGSLEKGLAAGLGAYGGAGLASGLSAAGAAAAQPALSGATMAGTGTAAASGLGSQLPAAVMDNASPQALGALGEVAPAATAAQALPAATAGQLGANGIGGVMANPSFSASLPQPSFAQQLSQNASNLGGGLRSLVTNPTGAIGPGGKSALDYMGGAMGIGSNALMAATPMLNAQGQQTQSMPAQDDGMIRPYTFNRTAIPGAGSGQRHFNQSYTELPAVKADDFKGFAAGGDVARPTGLNALVQQQQNSQASQPWQGKQVFEFDRTAVDPSQNGGRQFSQTYTERPMTQADYEAGRTAYQPDLQYDAAGNPIEKDTRNSMLTSVFGGLGSAQQMAQAGPTGGDAGGGVPTFRPTAQLGADGQVQQPQGGYQGFQQYARGGGVAGLLRGPGNGQSDSIPANIEGGPQAALSDGEYVVPADVVSALGSGSTDAGSRELDAMMGRVRQAAHGKRKQMKKVKPAAVLSA